jgi:hypothetical protein
MVTVTTAIDSTAAISSTDKSLSEALIFASTKPKYDKRLFMELP